MCHSLAVAKDWGLEWRLVPPRGRESCRWQSVDNAWVSLTLGHQGDITRIVVSASDGRVEVVEGYEEGLNLARRWRSSWISKRAPTPEEPPPSFPTMPPLRTSQERASRSGRPISSSSSPRQSTSGASGGSAGGPAGGLASGLASGASGPGGLASGTSGSGGAASGASGPGGLGGSSGSGGATAGSPSVTSGGGLLRRELEKTRAPLPRLGDPRPDAPHPAAAERPGGSGLPRPSLGTEARAEEASRRSAPPRRITRPPTLPPLQPDDTAILPGSTLPTLPGGSLNDREARGSLHDQATTRLSPVPGRLSSGRSLPGAAQAAVATPSLRSPRQAPGPSPVQPGPKEPAGATTRPPETPDATPNPLPRRRG